MEVASTPARAPSLGLSLFDIGVVAVPAASLSEPQPDARRNVFPGDMARAARGLQQLGSLLRQGSEDAARASHRYTARLSGCGCRQRPIRSHRLDVEGP